MLPFYSQGCVSGVETLLASQHHRSFGFPICPRFTQRCDKQWWHCHILYYGTRRCSSSSLNHTRNNNTPGTASDSFAPSSKHSDFHSELQSTTTVHTEWGTIHTGGEEILITSYVICTHFSGTQHFPSNMWFLMPLHKKIHTEVTMLIDYLEEAINIPQRTMHLSILCSCFLSFFGLQSSQ